MSGCATNMVLKTVNSKHWTDSRLLGGTHIHTRTVSQSQLVVCIGQIQLTRKQTSRRQPKIPPRVREPRVVLGEFVCVMCVTLQCRGGTLASVACSYFSAPTDSHPHHTPGQLILLPAAGTDRHLIRNCGCNVYNNNGSRSNNNSVISVHM